MAPSMGSSSATVPAGFGAALGAAAGADDGDALGDADGAGAGAEPPPQAALIAMKMAREQTVTDLIMIDDARARSPGLPKGQTTQHRSLPAATDRTHRNTPRPPSRPQQAPTRRRQLKPTAWWQPSFDSSPTDPKAGRRPARRRVRSCNRAAHRSCRKPDTFSRRLAGAMPSDRPSAARRPWWSAPPATATLPTVRTR